MACRRNCSKIFPSTELRLTGWFGCCVSCSQKPSYSLCSWFNSHQHQLGTYIKTTLVHICIFLSLHFPVAILNAHVLKRREKKLLLQHSPSVQPFECQIQVHVSGDFVRLNRSTRKGSLNLISLPFYGSKRQHPGVWRGKILQKHLYETNCGDNYTKSSVLLLLCYLPAVFLEPLSKQLIFSCLSDMFHCFLINYTIPIVLKPFRAFYHLLYNCTIKMYFKCKADPLP